MHATRPVVHEPRRAISDTRPSDSDLRQPTLNVDTPSTHTPPCEAVCPRRSTNHLGRWEPIHSTHPPAPTPTPSTLWVNANQSPGDKRMGTPREDKERTMSSTISGTVTPTICSTRDGDDHTTLEQPTSRCVVPSRMRERFLPQLKRPREQTSLTCLRDEVCERVSLSSQCVAAAWPFFFSSNARPLRPPGFGGKAFWVHEDLSNHLRAERRGRSRPFDALVGHKAGLVGTFLLPEVVDISRKKKTLRVREQESRAGNSRTPTSFKTKHGHYGPVHRWSLVRWSCRLR